MSAAHCPTTTLAEADLKRNRRIDLRFVLSSHVSELKRLPDEIRAAKRRRAVGAARIALRELAALRDACWRTSLGLPVVSLCWRQAEAQPSLDGVAALPSASVLEAVRRELQSACAVAGGGKPFCPDVANDSPCWNECWPASFPGLLEAFLRAAQARWLRDLVEAWLRDFGADASFCEAGYAIARLLTGDKHRLTAWRSAMSASRCST